MRRVIGLAAVALAVSGCGSAGLAQSIAWHTTCLPARYGSPAWSPDGESIYYTYVDPATTQHTIHVMSRLGGGDRLLLGNAHLPIPSPDGKSLLYWDGSRAGFIRSERSLLDLATGRDRSLGELGETQSWSPDGKWIAYVEHKPKRHLMKMEAASGASYALTLADPDQFIGDDLPIWSPDGESIAVTADRGGTQAVYLLDMASGEIARLPGQDDPACTASHGKTVNTALGWSPDSSRLIVGRACGADRSLAAITAGGEVVMQWNYPSAGIVSAEWSPDGETIAVMVFTGASYQLDVMRVDIAAPDRQTVSGIEGYPPRWSPGGDPRVVFVDKGQNGFPDMYTIAPDGSGRAQITQNPGAGVICLH